MEFLITVGYIVLCVLMFSLAIAIHEFGHFIVALKLGLRVERFSIGFGPAIWKKTINGVEYRISWIPLGGYVSIPDVDPEGTKAIEGATSEPAQPKTRIPAWKELLVAVAGPAMNVVLAVVLAVILALIPSAKFGQLSTEIGGFTQGSVAKAAGLQKGDIITAVAGHPVATWSELQTEVQITDGKPTVFSVKRPKALEKSVDMTVQVPSVSEGETWSFGACPFTQVSVPRVTGFWPDSVAEKAGMRIDDLILSVNGESVQTDADVFRLVQESSADANISIEFLRDGVAQAVEFHPVLAKLQIGDDWVSGTFLQVALATNQPPAIVKHVDADSPAAQAGLQPGDCVSTVNGTVVYSWTDVERELRAMAGQAAQLVVTRAVPSAEREYEETEVTIAPHRDPNSGALFIQASSVANVSGASAWMPARNPFKQIAWDAGAIFRCLKALVTPKEAKATSKSLGGPVLIAQGIYKSTRHDFKDGLGFLRFLNTNLAIMNLLPIPVLDGGLILFALIALIFRRRIPDKIIGVLSMCFMYLLLAVMGWLIFSDSLRSWRMHHVENPAEKIELVVPEGMNAV